MANHADKIIRLREIFTNKNEMARGARSVEEVPVKEKVRIVAVGFHDVDVLEGRVETSS
jgi:hypothetical protein